MKDRIQKAVDARHSSLVELFHDLHRHPELSGQEERTARVIADRLRAAGLEVQTGVGGHGVVGVLRGGKPGPVVAYRADMDAIESVAPDPAPFAAETPGIRHGCGHDMHVTVGVGIAETLAAMRDELPGTVKFIFQPAEEIGQGAAGMIADEVLANPNPEAIFAVHCAPLEVGQFASAHGMLLPGLDIVTVSLSGDGNIQAAAEKCSQLVSSINSMGAATASEAAESTGTVMANAFIVAVPLGAHAAGDGSQVLQAMVRASSPEQHALAKSKIEKGLESLDVPDVKYDLQYTEYALPPVMNDVALAKRGDDVIRDVAGDNAVIVLEETTPFFSEDFAFFQQHIPGVMYFLGVSNSEKGTMGLPHDPVFVADDGAIITGASSMTAVLVDYLEHHAKP